MNTRSIFCKYIWFNILYSSFRYNDYIAESYLTFSGRLNFTRSLMWDLYKRIREIDANNRIVKHLRCSIAVDSLFARRTALLAMTSTKTQACRASCGGFARCWAKKALRNKQRYVHLLTRRSRAKKKKKNKSRQKENPRRNPSILRHASLRLFTLTILGRSRGMILSPNAIPSFFNRVASFLTWTIIGVIIFLSIYTEARIILFMLIDDMFFYVSIELLYMIDNENRC